MKRRSFRAVYNAIQSARVVHMQSHTEYFTIRDKIDILLRAVGNVMIKQC